MLPVGRVDDVERVLALLLPDAGLAPVPAEEQPAVPVAVPELAAVPAAVSGAAVLPVAPVAPTPSLVERGLTSKGGADGYTNAPRRAAWLRPFSWRRTGFALTPNTVLLRRGVIARELTLVPFARVQSVGVSQGPIQRRLDLGGVHLHTVAGPVSAQLGVLDRLVAAELFEQLARGAVASAASDTSHHWGTPPEVL